MLPFSSISMQIQRTRNPRRAAVTLLELVVVLGILALLAGVAVQSLDPIANQSRYELTQSVLNAMSIAIVGDPDANNMNGQRTISGYVSNTGTLPTSVDDLLIRPTALLAYGTQSFDSDRDLVNDLTLSRGWNGPYLRLGAGRTSILDGWGNMPLLQNNAGMLTIVSRGSDNDSVPPENGYQADLAATIAVSAYTGDVVFHLYAINPVNGARVDPTLTNLLTGIAVPPVQTKLLGIHFYAKNASGGTTGIVQELMCPVSMSGTYEYRISNALLGSAAARAVFWVDLNNDQSVSTGETILRKSTLNVFNIVPGCENRFDLELL
jgi:type II secretory pathway pseudopilin PulG